MTDISYKIPEMIERFKYRAKVGAGILVGATALVALGIAL